jgi:predicted transposase/invertase (TIGR01784 family)
MKYKSKEKINQAHDAYGKEALSRKEVATDFLKGHLPQELLARIDLASLELTKGDFADDFFQYHNDITYKAKIDHQEGLIYFSIELQGKPEELMAFRMLCYLVWLLKTYLKQNKGAKKLPLVLPICLYHGPKKYPFSNSIYDCFQQAAIARKYQLCERFMLWDLNNFSSEELLNHGSASFFQTLYKASHTGDFSQLVQRFSPEFLSTLASSYLYSSARYISDQSDATKGEEALKLLADSITNADKQRLIMSYSDKLRQEGIEQGMQQGMQQEKLGIARTMLKGKEPKEKVVKFTGLTKQELAKLVREMGPN